VVFASAARTTEGSESLFGFYCSSVRSNSCDSTETSTTTGVLRSVRVGGDKESKQWMQVFFFMFRAVLETCGVVGGTS
jgi:hypothetical protein